MRLLKTLSEREKFSAVEQNIIKYILDNPKEIVNMSIRELANKTFTSSAAIFRLCQKCGLKGYTEFKIKFISEVNRTSDFENDELEKPIRDLHRPINGKDDVKSVVRKMAFLQIEAIEETKNEINYKQLERVADMMNAAGQIVFFGFDLNYYISQSTVYHLVQTGKPAVVYETVNNQVAKAVMFKKEDVAILISRTGENKNLIRISQVLKRKGAKIILLSASRDTSLDKLCDEFIYIANVIDYLSMGGVIFSVGCRYILDVLFGILLSKNYKSVEKFVGKFETVNGKSVHDPNRLW
ncbi:MurR/RpiR family transcriptional regulator [Megamonas hypermegale]|uniref:MurR/RpiR family transcriptional regulator n=1 Tax=Megamonas hypermegale TaxID=158847 RepID=UPI0025A3C9F8|nr:MurR/RpiR family transcriptional regulator [Megamonas hypermegale]MDM8142423.1 MurR/RpiR family transcriptional regulator [Megamonas hypermegale]